MRKTIEVCAQSVTRMRGGRELRARAPGARGSWIHGVLAGDREDEERGQAKRGCCASSLRLI